MRMGLYYSGGYDWTFVPGPIRVPADYQAVKPQSEAYGKYADAQIRELIARYHPAVLWNDIDWPKSGHPLEIMADYYNTVPDGVVDDRFGVKHSDFTSPEYKKVDEIQTTKWEECRGLGRSFGYNRAEGEAETIAPDALIYLLADIVSKNGNLLLGCRSRSGRNHSAGADGTVARAGRMATPERRCDLRHAAVDARRRQSKEGISVRFTRKNGNLYAILLGTPKQPEVTLLDVAAKPGTCTPSSGLCATAQVERRRRKPESPACRILPGQYAYVLQLQSAN